MILCLATRVAFEILLLHNRLLVQYKSPLTRTGSKLLSAIGLLAISHSFHEVN
jgi:hypothetical protein